MFILENPYVSNFLKETVESSTIPVLENDVAINLELNSKTQFLDSASAVRHFKTSHNARVYTNSENAIEWIAEHLKGTNLPEKINWFKDKVAFRKLTENLFPEVFYQSIRPEELDTINIYDLPKPFVIKPAVGFLSLAVYPVLKNEDWPAIKENLKVELKEAAQIFPQEVLGANRLIIEGYIPGVEFAFDAYYDENGEPSILNILKHEFASADDVSDRVYVTSREVMKTYLPPFTKFLRDLGELTNLKNFPLHVEVRVDEKGKLLPIEVNPLRFGGFCTTADLTPYAWGFNPYMAFFNNFKPNWDEILKDKAGLLYGLIVLDNSTGYKTSEIKSFDYKKLVSQFEKPLEIRELDYRKYPVFGFLFTETREENFQELAAILQSDLREFVQL